MIHRFALLLVLIAHNMVSAKKLTDAYSVNADSIEYDRKLNAIKAKGHVVVFKEGYSLRASEIIYDKAHGKVFMRKDTSIITPSGDEVYAKYLEIDTILKELKGDVVSARVKADNKFIAEKIHHDHLGDTTFSNVLYSSCPVCQGQDPQWQVQSSRIIYTAKENVSFWNNFFEVYGIPVFYLPYFKTSAPDAEPKSGFLLPKTYRYRDVYGYGITIPYYLRIADNKELTYAPLVATKHVVLHQADYKHLTRDGYYTLHAEYLRQKRPVGAPYNRYYVNGDAVHNINQYFQLKGKIDRVSDKSYLNNYWDKNPNYLTSSAEVNYINNRDYGYLRTYGFQGLRADNADSDTPLILPVGRYHTDLLFQNQNRVPIDFQTVNMMRKRGADSRKSSLHLGWHKTYLIGNSEVEVQRNLRADFFNFAHKKDALSVNRLDNNNSQNVYRVHPELYTTWKYPLIRVATNSVTYVEPIASFIISPNSSSNGKVSVNDDSQDIEISDTNVFSANRYSGIDFIEHGIRANYGIVSSTTMDNGVEYSLLLGQSYRLKKSDEYTADSGLKNKHFSDYVGRAAVKPFKFLELYYRMRLDSAAAKIRKGGLGADLNMNLDRPMLHAVEINTRFDHYDLPPHGTQDVNERLDIKKSLSVGGKIHLNKEWYIIGETVRNFTDSGNFPILSKGGIGYNGACSDIKILVTKRYTTDPKRHIFPTKGIVFELQVSLKGIN